jgi:hypothetical protein
MQSSQLIYTSERLINSENVVRESSRIQGQDLSKYYTTNPYKDQYNDEDHKKKDRNHTILRLAFVEKLDLILAASEDGNVYLWGFDQEAVHILKNMKPLMKSNQNDAKSDAVNSLASNSLNSLNTSQLTDYSENVEKSKVKSDSDSVTNRVAGFTLRKIFSEHTSCVTSLAIVDNPDVYNSKMFLLTAGWDRYCNRSTERMDFRSERSV